jgi:hypothetical protein
MAKCGNQDQNVPCFRERDRELESISLQPSSGESVSRWISPSHLLKPAVVAAGGPRRHARVGGMSQTHRLAAILAADAAGPLAADVSIGYWLR